MMYGSICNGLAYMPDEDLAEAFITAKTFQVTSMGSDEARVIAYHGESFVQAQRRPGGKGWEALTLTQRPKGCAPSTGVPLADIPKAAWATLDFMLSMLRGRFGDNFIERVTVKVK